MKIAAAGISCLDYIVTSARPEWGGTAWVSGFQTQGGGLAATAIVACARLGAECSLFSLLGDDPVRDTILSELNEEGVNTNGVVRVPGGQSPFSFVHVDETTGERTIFHRKAVFPSGPPSVDVALPSDAQALLVDWVYADLALVAAKTARAREIPVVADLTPNADNEELIRNIDVVIAPQEYARGLGLAPESALDKIRRMGPKTAVITLGADGCVWSDETGCGHTPAFKVEVVDTTGAGDAFHGGFCYGLAQSWDTAKCCEFAAAVAAIKCAKSGGRTGLPSLEQTLTFLAERNRDVSGFPLRSNPETQE